MQFTMKQNYQYDQTLLPSIINPSISSSNCYQYRLPYLQAHQYLQHRNYKSVEQLIPHKDSQQQKEINKNKYLLKKKSYSSNLSPQENQNWQKISYENYLQGSRLSNLRYLNDEKRKKKPEKMRAISHISRLQSKEQKLYEYLKNAKTEQKLKYSRKDTIIKPKSSFPKIKQKNQHRQVGSSSFIRINQEQYQQNSKQAFKITLVNQKTQFIRNRRTFFDIYFANKKQNKIIGKMDPRIPYVPSKNQLQDFILHYKTTNDEINISSLLKANFCVVEYSPLQLYIGEMISKHKNGKGIYITPQSCYEGSWKNNEKVKGLQITTSGIFQGTYKNNLRNGQGQFQKHTGEIYVGEWSKGKKHGNGLWVNTHGESYNGSWKQGKPEGKGTLTLKDRLYKGYFYNFKEEGFGRELFSNGDTFEGIYKEGLPCGRGIYHWKNNNFYIGPFQRGLRCGIGEFHQKQKAVFRGLFVDDKLQGKCQILMSNGKIYDGRCKKDFSPLI